MIGHMRLMTTEGMTVDRKLDEPPSLETLQKAVGGYIQKVPHMEALVVAGARYRAVAWCNEEGKLRGLPINVPATNCWIGALGFVPDDFLVGNIVIVYGDAEFMAADAE